MILSARLHCESDAETIASVGSHFHGASHEHLTVQMQALLTVFHHKNIISTHCTCAGKIGLCIIQFMSRLISLYW